MYSGYEGDNDPPVKHARGKRSLGPEGELIGVRKSKRPNN